MTLRKYLDSYLYLEYFQKSNLVLGIFWIFLAIPETKSKSYSQESGFTLPIQNPSSATTNAILIACVLTHSKVAAIRLQLQEQLIASCNRALTQTKGPRQSQSRWQCRKERLSIMACLAMRCSKQSRKNMSSNIRCLWVKLRWLFRRRNNLIDQRFGLLSTNRVHSLM